MEQNLAPSLKLVALITEEYRSEIFLTSVISTLLLWRLIETTSLVQLCTKFSLLCQMSSSFLPFTKGPVHDCSFAVRSSHAAFLKNKP